MSDHRREDESRWIAKMRLRHAIGDYYVCGLADVLRTLDERDEARDEVADLSNKYTASWKCSLDVPEDPCFDCIRCLRLRLKGRP